MLTSPAGDESGEQPGRAAGLVDTARDRAAQLVAEAERHRQDAEDIAQRARVQADDVLYRAGRELETAKESAERSRRRAEEDIQQLRQQAEEDSAGERRRAEAEAERTAAAARNSAVESARHAREELAGARADAERIVADADGDAAQARKAAEQILDRARSRSDAAEELLLAAKAAKEEADEHWRKALSRTERRLAKRRLRWNDKHARKAARPTIGSRLVNFGAWWRNLVRNQARRVLVGGPIIAPMAVAWWSQTDYARTAFGWWTIFALGFAAAWELTTAFTGWMYHQARKMGDSGALYRFMTWVFAAGAAAMNYAHHCAPDGRPTQSAVAFATMSIVGMVLWELYALLMHRQYLREQGLLSRPRPRVGLIRWSRYPVQSWTAWSLTITDSSLTTLDRAWAAAGQALKDRAADYAVRAAARTAQRTARAADRTALRAGLIRHRVVVPRLRAGQLGPAAIPTFRPATTVDRTVKWTALTGPTAGRSDPAAGPDRSAPPLIGPDRTVPAPKPDRTAVDRDGTDRSGPDRTVAAEPSSRARIGPDHAPAVDGPDRPHRTGPHPDAGPDRPRSGPADRAATPGPVRTVGQADRSPDRTGLGANRRAAAQSGLDRGPDRTARSGPAAAHQVVLTEAEQAAVDRLTAQRKRLSKRNIADEVRSAGGSIASDRAALLATTLSRLPAGI